MSIILRLIIWTPLLNYNLARLAIAFLSILLEKELMETGKVRNHYPWEPGKATAENTHIVIPAKPTSVCPHRSFPLLWCLIRWKRRLPAASDCLNAALSFFLQAYMRCWKSHFNQLKTSEQEKVGRLGGWVRAENCFEYTHTLRSDRSLAHAQKCFPRATARTQPLNAWPSLVLVPAFSDGMHRCEITSAKHLGAACKSVQKSPHSHNFEVFQPSAPLPSRGMTWWEILAAPPRVTSSRSRGDNGALSISFSSLVILSRLTFIYHFNLWPLLYYFFRLL